MKRIDETLDFVQKEFEKYHKLFTTFEEGNLKKLNDLKGEKSCS